jgi:3-oxoacyl-[acyl-carrier protein] reductase
VVVSRVLVTGGTRGIGRAIAERLVASSVKVAVVGRTVAEVPGAVSFAADLAAEGCEAVVDQAADALGGLDALVNCAGVVRYGSIGTVGRGELVEQLAVNVVAPFLIAQSAARYMTHGGAIVQVASTLGVRPAPGTAAYAASKAALLSLTRSFAQELAPRGVRVNAVVPGVVDTDMVRGRDLEALRALHPLGRLGTPGDVAEAVVWLLGAEWVTGAEVVVDGGLLVG